MAFGISKNIFSLLLNPYLIYVNFKRKKLLKKYRDKSLLVENFVSITNSKIGYYVFLGTKVQLNNSEIGDHSYVNSNSIINNTKIGKFCSIASYVRFDLGYHPTHLISTHPAFYSNNHPYKTYAKKNAFTKVEKIVLGNDVWIGESVKIMGGVNIGDGAIIAAGAVVTKDVKPYEIVGGVPAKHIKYRINENLIEKIRATKWWDKDEHWFEENFELFLNTEMFLKYFEKDV